MLISAKAGRQRDSMRLRNMWKEQGRVITPQAHDKFVVSARERCVRIKSTHRDGKRTTGTGVIVQTGLVITNWHLIEDPSIIAMSVNDHEAQMVHFDFVHDLVALASTTRRLGHIRIQEALPRQMQGVFYVGNPEDWNKSIVEGAVTSVARDIIRSSNCPALGFSGSGLYSKESGELIGLIDGMQGSSGVGLVFATSVPGHIVRDFLHETFARMRMRKKPVLAEKEKKPEKIHTPTKLF